MYSWRHFGVFFTHPLHCRCVLQAWPLKTRGVYVLLLKTMFAKYNKPHVFQYLSPKCRIFFRRSPARPSRARAVDQPAYRPFFTTPGSLRRRGVCRLESRKRRSRRALLTYPWQAIHSIEVTDLFHGGDYNVRYSWWGKLELIKITGLWHFPWSTDCLFSEFCLPGLSERNKNWLCSCCR